jgi:hypothetical protein
MSSVLPQVRISSIFAFRYLFVVYRTCVLPHVHVHLKGNYLAAVPICDLSAMRERCISCYLSYSVSCDDSVTCRVVCVTKITGSSSDDWIY